MARSIFGYSVSSALIASSNAEIIGLKGNVRSERIGERSKKKEGVRGRKEREEECVCVPAFVPTRFRFRGYQILTSKIA